MTKGAHAIVFLGPSLPLAEARKLLPRATFLPPARQGDVWRALESRPHAIALIDGVFESQPSVWHRELLDALSAGVHVLGASSMGALRAAELHTLGMEGVGAIFTAYASGELIDDADVALLHSDSAHAYRPLTVPMVDARHAIALATKRKLVTPAESTRLLREAERTFYQERRWASLLEASKLSPRSLAHWQRAFKHGVPSLKSDDARACLVRLRQILDMSTNPRKSAPSKGLDANSRTRPASAPGAAARSSPTRWPSSHARRRRLVSGHSTFSGHRLANEHLLLALESRADAAELIANGTRKLLLARLAQAQGVRLSAESTQADPALGLAADEVRQHAELLALDAHALDFGHQWISDGPSQLEALAFEARTTGLWTRLGHELVHRRSTPTSRNPREITRRRRSP